MSYATTRHFSRLVHAPLRAAAVAVVALWFAAQPASALQEHPSNPTHRGVMSVDTYQIFPENRAGNGVYFQQRLLVSLPGETIRHLSPLPKAGRFAYVATNAEGKARVGVFVQAQDKLNRVNEVGKDFYHATVTLEGVVYKKLYRIVEGRTVVDLLTSSKTADGPTPGERGLAFYHISAAIEPDPAAGITEKQFSMQIHLMLYDEDQVRHYEFPVLARLPQMALSWTDPEHVTYKLDDGRSEILSISQFQ